MKEPSFEVNEAARNQEQIDRLRSLEFEHDHSEIKNVLLINMRDFGAAKRQQESIGNLGNALIEAVTKESSGETPEFGIEKIKEEAARIAEAERNNGMVSSHYLATKEAIRQFAQKYGLDVSLNGLASATEVERAIDRELKAKLYELGAAQ